MNRPDVGRPVEDADTRGQLVLLAAAALAIALMPLALAYLQLGYAGDVAAEPTGAGPGADVHRSLDRAAHAATREVAGEYDWAERTTAAAEYERAFLGRVAELETGRLAAGAAAEIEVAPSVASTWAAEACPEGANRVFGPCETRGGVVVQERAGEAAIVAVAVDVRETRSTGTAEFTTVVTLG